MKKSLFIYNPLSGGRTVPRKLDYIIERFMDHDTLAVPFRLCGDEQERLVETLKSDEYASVVVSGGDGSVNSVINTLLRNDIQIPVGLIPSGTCNDFARSLEIPNDLKRCMDIILAGKTSEIDTGLINGETYFLNTCAGGNFVDVSYSTSSDFKMKFGPLAYYLKALGEVSAIHPVHLKVTTDHEIVEGEFLFFLILNGRHAAGFNNVIEKADISDGYMDILLLRNCLHIDLAGLFFKVLGNDFLSDRNVMWLRTKNCTIEGDCHFPLTLDGEKWGCPPIKVEFINRNLRVFVK